MQLGAFFIKAMNQKMVDMLAGGDLRSIGKVEQLLSLIKSQDDFDELFQLLSSPVRIVAMRAADAIEKITLLHPAFLEKHKTEILRLLNLAQHIEFKWHLALLVSRIPLNIEELRSVWTKLKTWATDTTESKIVRVNALQAMTELSRESNILRAELETLLQKIEKEGIPSLNARIRKLKITR